MIALVELATQLNVTEAYLAEVIDRLAATVWDDSLSPYTAGWVADVIANGGPSEKPARTFPADGSDLYVDRRVDQENRMARGEWA
jgi:hypothetical protein